ncbi:MAG: hypothetical protein LUC91_11585 [Prevotella sp.]|nr:hypothetical protein [Prevotella sp.]
MGKIFILGNDDSSSWAYSLGKVETIPTSSKKNNSEVIHDFVLNFLREAKSDDKIVIDMDASELGSLSLTIAMHIRLSVEDLKERAFLPIIFVSYFPLQSFLKQSECGQFFLSHDGYAFCTPEDVANVIPNVNSISPERFKTDFLDCIQIHPTENIGSHSMANQWGADVLNRIINKDTDTVIPEIAREKTKLYYKYIFLKTYNINDVLKGNLGGVAKTNVKLNALQKKILLIDDEAQKGWAIVLKNWLFGSTIDVCDNQIGSYDDLPEQIKSNIEKDYYDLYLLDLRLLGNKEDDIYNAEEFSGMKILRKLKEINIGNQVVILTASNKAWNMKALLDAGADGYYIKESPELQLPWIFSENNFKSFQHDVENALNNNNYKKKLYRDVNALKKLLKKSSKFDDDEILNDLIAFIESSAKQVMEAKIKEDFAYSYFSLYQVLERLSKDYITPDGNKRDCWLVNFDTPLYKYKIDGFKPVEGPKIIKERPSMMEKLTAIYIEVGSKTDCKFIREDIALAINRRNTFVHEKWKLTDDTFYQNLSKENKSENKKLREIFKKDGYIHLLKTIQTIMESIC